ncbi:hypothetical protein AB0C76_25950 [Kitasatospora sp. NPDC048722]|uniref:hypothetical protein n=1 Tax=Kitasatospora sp. NPDC048722 TaxID=3155639 RepID=UPI0033D3739F
MWPGVADDGGAGRGAAQGFHQRGVPDHPRVRVAYDPAARAELWRRSLDLVGHPGL